jgi:hypothetical protein
MLALVVDMAGVCVPLPLPSLVTEDEAVVAPPMLAVATAVAAVVVISTRKSGASSKHLAGASEGLPKHSSTANESS